MIQSKRMRMGMAIAAVLSLAFLSACGSNKPANQPNVPAPKANQAAEGDAPARKLDEANKIEKRVAAKEGGALALKASDGATIHILFPQGSLKKDANLMVAPLLQAPLNGNDILSKGFSLEEKGAGVGPELNFPALLIFTLNGDLGQDVSIVRYDGKGGYEVIPTKVVASKAKTVLTASLDHFSDYGAKKIEPREKEVNKTVKDFDWVMYIKDTANLAIGPMKVAVSLDMRAVNASGDIEGEYKAQATAQVGNKMSASGGSLTADSVSKAKPFTFMVKPGSGPAPVTAGNADDDIELVPLVPPSKDNGGDDIELIPLVPPSNWLANGNITMVTGPIAGKIKAMGQTAEVTADGNTSTLPFTMTIAGTEVTMRVDFPDAGTALFHGFIRGEGKKPAKDDLDDFEPIPLPPPQSQKKSSQDSDPPLIPPIPKKIPGMDDIPLIPPVKIPNLPNY